MSFLLDTNIISAHLRRPGGLAHRFFQYSGRLYTTTLVLAEVYDWVLRRPDSDAAQDAVDKLLHHEVAVLDFDHDCALRYGHLRVDLRRRGIEVAAVDLMIGAVALVYDFTLVTHNTRDFQNIPGLRLADWLTP